MNRALVLAGALALVARPAAAGPVIVAALCDDAPALHQLTPGLADALRQRGLTVGDLGDRSAVRCTTALDGVAHQVREGKELFHQLKLKAARTQLAAALEQLAELDLLATALRREALLYLGWLELEQGDPSRAAPWLATLTRLWPDWQPNLNDYPPHVVEAVTAAAAAGQRAPRGALAVRTAVPGARVTIDGVDRCQTPCTVGELVAGEHHLQLDGPGGQHRRFITIPEAATVMVEPELTDSVTRATLLELARGGDSGGLTAALRGVGADDAVLLLPAARARRTQVIVVAQGKGLSVFESERFDETLARVGEVLAAPAPAETVAAAELPLWAPSQAPPSTFARLREAPWFWWVVSAGAAVIVAGTATGVYLYDRQHDRVRVVVSP